MIYVCGDSFAVPDLEYGPCWVDLLQQKLPVKTLRSEEHTSELQSH